MYPATSKDNAMNATAKIEIVRAAQWIAASKSLFERALDQSPVAMRRTAGRACASYLKADRALSRASRAARGRMMHPETHDKAACVMVQSLVVTAMAWRNSADFARCMSMVGGPLA